MVLEKKQGSLMCPKADCTGWGGLGGSTVARCLIGTHNVTLSYVPNGLSPRFKLDRGMKLLRQVVEILEGENGAWEAGMSMRRNQYLEKKHSVHLHAPPVHHSPLTHLLPLALNDTTYACFRSSPSTR